MPLVCWGEYSRTPQEPTLATYAPKVEKSEAEMHVDRDASREYDRFRAFTPSPGAYLQTRLGHLRVSSARLRPDLDPGPGVVILMDRELAVGFKDGAIALREIQPEGKKRMSGSDFANGARLTSGDCLRP
jgi:methionyl-tRNA formyltransferase